MDAPFRGNDGKERDLNLVAMLSLYLLLLAFFILLNALSRLESDRTRTVIESINEAFDGQVRAPSSAKPYSAALGPLEDAAALIEELRQLFDSMLPAIASETAADGPVLRLELSAEVLFMPRSSALRGGRAPLIERIARALRKAENAGLFVELELFHGLAAAPSAAQAAAGLEVQRMGVLVRAFAERGVPAERLSVGVLADKAGIVQLIFRVYREPPAQIDLAGAAE